MIIDQEFPRTDDQLRCTAVTLGELSMRARHKGLILAVPDIFVDVARDFDWNYARGSIRSEIYHLLNLLLFQPHNGVGRIRFRATAEYQDHPVPEYCNDLGNVEFWASEMGKVVALHRACPEFGGRCAGVACVLAFSGDPIGEYRQSEAPRFPLVGPRELEDLIDAFEWETSQNDHTIRVGYREVCKNYRLIGAVTNDMNAQGHDVLRFKSGASWPFSKKWGDNFSNECLGELEEHANLPLRIIKRALGRGLKPKPVLRGCLGQIEIVGF